MCPQGDGESAIYNRGGAQAAARILHKHPPQGAKKEQGREHHGRWTTKRVAIPQHILTPSRLHTRTGGEEESEPRRKKPPGETQLMWATTRRSR